MMADPTISTATLLVWLAVRCNGAVCEGRLPWLNLSSDYLRALSS
jgi:hypothetical protein